MCRQPNVAQRSAHSTTQKKAAPPPPPPEGDEGEDKSAPTTAVMLANPKVKEGPAPEVCAAARWT